MYLSQQELKSIKIKALALQDLAKEVLDQVSELEGKSLLEDGATKRQSPKRENGFDKFKASMIGRGLKSRVRNSLT